MARNSRSILWSCLVMLCGFGCDDEPSVSARSAPVIPDPPAPVAALPPAQPPGFPLIDDGILLRAPERFDHIVPRLVPPTGPRFRNLVYEANNVTMRGPRGEDGFYESTGEAIAERWRVAAAGVHRAMALRDALFSQQDHPIDHDPVSLMIPMNWVTVAVAEVAGQRELRAVQAPPLDDDAAWAALNTPQKLFGSFPVSDRLYETATTRRSVLAPERMRVTNARRAVHMLARGARAMVEAVEQGPQAVADAGAASIVEGDDLYFGRRLRREHLVLIAVENPNRVELQDEDKGFGVSGRQLPSESMAMARRAVFRQRLANGDIALERYNITREPERERAIEVLLELVGRDDPVPGNYTVWVFVNAGADSRRGRDVLAHIPQFRQEVALAGVDLRRVRFYATPHVPLGGRAIASQLDSAARRYRGMANLPMGVNIGSASLRRLFEELER